MNPSLRKEFRPLLIPWSVAALAGFGHLIGLSDRGAFAELLAGLAAFAFIAGCLLLAALPLGLEFQQRTLPLLIGQPVERSRLWREKFLAGTAAVLALAAVHGAIVISMGRKFPLQDLLPWVGFVAATVCSAGLGILTARSAIGGMVFAASWQFGVVIGVTGFIYACYRALGRDPDDPEISQWPIVMTYVSAGVAYSAWSLWLGWRKFAELEVRDGPVSGEIALPEWMTPRRWATLLRCTPANSLRNLIRKEVCLQRPIFTIAAVLSAGWLVTLVMYALQPTRHELFQGTFGGLTALHIIIVVLLVGCISMGEEKSLGIAGWHLTLPVSARRQWFVKLLVAAATVVVVGVVLPLLLACVTLIKAKVGLVALARGDIWQIAAISTVVFVVSFWSASLLGNTLRAAVATVLATIGIAICGTLANWFFDRFFNTGMESAILTSLIANWQLPPDFFLSHPVIGRCGTSLAILAVILVALAQSLAQFRRAQTRTSVMFRYSIVLVSVTFAVAFWCVVLWDSLSRPANSLTRELVTRLPPTLDVTTPADRRAVTFEELKENGQLSPWLMSWLKNASITVTYVDHPLTYQVAVRFPNDRTYQFHYEASKPLMRELILHLRPFLRSEVTPGVRAITVEELEQSGELSGWSKAWLDGASIAVAPVESRAAKRSGIPEYEGSIQFSNGRTFSFAFPLE